MVGDFNCKSLSVPYNTDVLELQPHDERLMKAALRGKQRKVSSAIKQHDASGFMYSGSRILFSAGQPFSHCVVYPVFLVSQNNPRNVNQNYTDLIWVNVSKILTIELPTYPCFLVPPRSSFSPRNFLLKYYRIGLIAFLKPLAVSAHLLAENLLTCSHLLTYLYTCFRQVISSFVHLARLFVLSVETVIKTSSKQPCVLRVHRLHTSVFFTKILKNLVLVNSTFVFKTSKMRW